MSNILSFNVDQFSSLTTNEYAQQWENISLDQLWEDEKQVIKTFLDLAKGDSDTELNFNNVLLVKTNDDRMLDRVYGPSIFRESEDGDGLVLKLGANSFPVRIENERVHCGHLKGRFQWLQKKRADETNYDLLTVRLSDDRDDDSLIDYEISCSLVTNESTIDENGVMKANPLFLSSKKLDKLLESNAGLGQFFSVPKSGGGSVFKMQMLQPNSEYEVVDITVTEHHLEYGVSYILRLAGGASTFARGNSELILKKNLASIRNHLQAGKALTLKVGEIKEFAPNKWSVNNALVFRQPALTGAIPKQVQQVRSGSGSALAPTRPVTQGFTATSGTSEEGFQWAIKQGVSIDAAKEFYEQINAFATERKEAGEHLHVNERRQMFIDAVKAYLTANPSQTVDVTASEVDDIPF